MENKLQPLLQLVQQAAQQGLNKETTASRDVIFMKG